MLPDTPLFPDDEFPPDVGYPPDDEYPPEDGYPDDEFLASLAQPVPAGGYTGAAPGEVLSRVFGYDSFRGDQQAIVEHVVGGGDALVLMPTGGGKSLCYQIPALVREGVGVVISPLIALMQDQVDALRAARRPGRVPELQRRIIGRRRRRVEAAFLQRRARSVVPGSGGGSAVVRRPRMRLLEQRLRSHCSR